MIPLSLNNVLFYQQYVVEEKEGSFFYQQYVVEWKE
jgi:hypothetical protein